MTRLITVRHYTPPHAGALCRAEATVISTANATEIFARCAPVASGTSRNACRIQCRTCYASLAAMLEQLGAGLANVVIEKAFFRNITADFDDFQQVRTQAYRHCGISRRSLPATTYLGQPPCRPGQDIELQVYAVVPTEADAVRIHALSPAGEDGTAKLIQIGPARHLYVSNIIGQGPNGSCDGGYERMPYPACDGGYARRPYPAIATMGEFRRQSDKMFEKARQLLQSQGIEFPDVVRTWIYLDDIDQDYEELNASRNAFFEREGVQRLPASTGIGGKLHPPGTRCSLDLYALLNPEIAELAIMQTPTLNEAHEYGSAFSRGMKMVLPEQTYLFISGTASVDEAGATAHVGDVRAQMERMLLNVEELLRPHGATFADLAHAVTFLKSAEDVQLYEQLCAQRGMTQLPHSIVQADVCRPELLSEMEGIAVLPTQ